MEKEKPLSPRSFAHRMQKLYEEYGGDREAVHAEMDDLMCNLLRSLGYGKGVEIFESTDKWYA